MVYPRDGCRRPIQGSIVRSQPPRKPTVARPPLVRDRPGREAALLQVKPIPQNRRQKTNQDSCLGCSCFHNRPGSDVRCHPFRTALSAFVVINPTKSFSSRLSALCCWWRPWLNACRFPPPSERGCLLCSGFSGIGLVLAAAQKESETTQAAPAKAMLMALPAQLK